MTIKRVVLGLVAMGVCAVGCVAVASGEDGSTLNVRAATAPADAAAAFAVFGRAPTAADEMPPDTRSVLSDVAARERVDLDRARAVAASAGRAVWAIPGQDAVCLAIPDPVDGFGINCATVDAASSGRLWVTLVGLSGQKVGDARIALLVPNGVDVVTAVADSGTSSDIAAHDNVAFADVTRGTIRYGNGSGARSVFVEGTPKALLASDR